MTCYSQKILKIFCWQISYPKVSAPPKHAPQNFLPRKFLLKKKCSPFCSPNFHPKEFAPQFCPPKNLLPNIFALHISSHNEILLTKIPPKYFCWRNFLLTRICPQKLGPQKFLQRKFALKRNCSPFCTPHKFSFKRICSPNISSQKFAAKHFCSPYYFSQKLLPKFCSPKIFAAQTTLWTSYGTWLIQVPWQGIVRCLQRFYWYFVICLKIVILLRVGEQKKTSRPKASWFLVKFTIWYRPLAYQHWQFMFTQ